MTSGSWDTLFSIAMLGLGYAAVADHFRHRELRRAADHLDDIATTLRWLRDRIDRGK